MFDYGTIDDLLKNTEHMEILRNNSLQDDGTDTVKGVDWFQYKGKTASTLYVSGNSWIGFGENTEQLKIVRRDTDLMTLRREEGTIWGTYKFLRIRWEGYSVHSNRIDATRMIWDAILFDTGESVSPLTRFQRAAVTWQIPVWLPGMARFPLRPLPERSSLLNRRIHLETALNTWIMRLFFLIHTIEGISSQMPMAHCIP